MEQIQKVAVIGAGAMGSQIAMLAAMAGCQTTMVDVDQERLDAAAGAQFERPAHRLTDRQLGQRRRGRADAEHVVARHPARGDRPLGVRGRACAAGDRPRPAVPSAARPP